MCGIAGWFGAAGIEARADFVGRILAEQTRRGPDHRGCITLRGGESASVLGHNRLAIIDLSESANQPFNRAGGSHWLTYNGEIYNYIELRQELVALGEHFKTQSDTEVLLAAWERLGPSALQRCNGMFAFAIYNRANDELFLVRDRFGVKPLYYSVAKNQVLFASTPGAVARCMGRGPSVEYAIRGLSVGIYDDETDLSAYDGVRPVPAGCIVRFRMADGVLSTELHRYYDLQERADDLRDTLAAAPFDQLSKEVATRLESATTLRLRSDVPVGVSLSGGVDSSSVAAFARAHDQLVAFSFGDPSEPLSEGPAVADVARMLGVPVRYVPSARGRTLADLFDATLAAQDAPFGGCSIIAQFAVCRRAREEGVKVLLGGQGGDEIFMGYHKFKLFRARELASQGRALSAALMWLSAVRSIRASNFGLSGLRRQFRRYSSSARHGGVLSTLRQEAPLPVLGYDSRSPLWKRQVRDVLSLSLPSLLRYEDRNSMGNSIETRLPLVDYRLVEFAIALPEAVKIRDGYGKWVLREAVRDRLPTRVTADRGKRGFDANHTYAIEAGLGELVRRRLHDVAGEIRTLTGAALDVVRDYSDRRLIGNATVLTEAISLIWLGQRSAGIAPIAGD